MLFQMTFETINTFTAEQQFNEIFGDSKAVR